MVSFDGGLTLCPQSHIGTKKYLVLLLAVAFERPSYFPSTPSRW